MALLKKILSFDPEKAKPCELLCLWVDGRIVLVDLSKAKQRQIVRFCVDTKLPVPSPLTDIQ